MKKELRANIFFWFLNNRSSIKLLFSVMAVISLMNSSAMAQSNGEWITAVDTVKIKISYQITACGGQDWIVLQVQNTSADSVSISWDDNLSSDTSKFTSKGVPNYRRSLHLSANQIVVGNCANMQPSERLLTLPLVLFLNNSYRKENLTYSVSGFTKSTL